MYCRPGCYVDGSNRQVSITSLAGGSEVKAPGWGCLCSSSSSTLRNVIKETSASEQTVQILLRSRPGSSYSESRRVWRIVWLVLSLQCAPLLLGSNSIWKWLMTFLLPSWHSFFFVREWFERDIISVASLSINTRGKHLTAWWDAETFKKANSQCFYFFTMLKPFIFIYAWEHMALSDNEGIMYCDILTQYHN